MANFEELSMAVLESSYKGGRRDREIEGYNREVKNMYADADDSKKSAARIIRNDSSENNFDNYYNNDETQNCINYINNEKKKVSNNIKTKNPLLRHKLKKRCGRKKSYIG